MKTSESIIKIAPAFLKAQKEIGSAKKGADNPFFKSKYADLPEVMAVCKQALNDNGIAVLQPVVGEHVQTILLHESGEWFMGKMRIVTKEMNNPQAQGSAVTYARRYGLQSMLFIPAEDDDGESAMARDKSIANIIDVNEIRANKIATGAIKETCKKCGGEMVVSNNTGKVYCKNKCWLEPGPYFDGVDSQDRTR